MQFDGAWYRRNRCVTVLWQLENERGGGYCGLGLFSRAGRQLGGGRVYSTP